MWKFFGWLPVRAGGQGIGGSDGARRGAEALALGTGCLGSGDGAGCRLLRVWLGSGDGARPGWNVFWNVLFKFDTVL